MKAVRYHRHGGPEVLVFEDVRDPEPGPQEILVRVRAAALNRMDTRMRSGGWPPPRILGADAAGDVAALGPNVAGPKVGDRVIIYPGISCGNCEFCDAGQHNWCSSYKLLGTQLDGGYAQYVIAPAINARPIPKGMGYIEAATLPICITTSWRVLFTKGQLRAGEWVMIHSAGSGVSVFASQMAKLAGAVVVTTTSTAEKEAKAKELGADHVINYRREDVATRVQELTEGRGVDLVIDHVGQATWAFSIGSLRKGGRMVTLGATSGALHPLNIFDLYRSEISILASGSHTRSDFDNGMRLVHQGRIRPVIDSVFALKEAAAAHQRLEAGLHFGKIALEVP
ncbi:MAG: zinc-binding dehydrogenase [Chloroflexi bacterium]|nr:zinc-binding dehydrogenase [Chloroflexota bacterium]